MGQENTMLIIHRPSCFIDRYRSFIIILDNQNVGKVKNADTFALPIEPGKHTLYLRIDWCRSAVIEFSVEGSEEIKFTCGPARVGWKILLSLLYATIWWNKYIWLEADTKKESIPVE